VISGNNTLIARAARMVWTCNPFSGATPTGNANGAARPATGALAAINSAAAGLATDGVPAWTDCWPAGVIAGISTQHERSVPWAWNIAAERASEAANANQRPRPLVNTFLPTSSSLMSLFLDYR
jgi:hypothetical protein